MNLATTLMLIFAINCSSQSQHTLKSSMTFNDSAINPLLKIGGCYAYEIKKGEIIGLLLASISKEEDIVYYSFLLSGKFFSKFLSKSDFQKAGLCGSKIPQVGGSFHLAFCKYFITERNLRSHINNLQLVDQINLSQKNGYGSISGINDLKDLESEFSSFKEKNAETEEQMKSLGFPIAIYQIVDWSNLAISDEEEIKPEIVRRLTKKTADPKAAEYMKEGWFWSQIDDLSPFGNDDGADAFQTFKEWRGKNKMTEPSIFLDELESRWGMSFAHKNITSERELNEIEKQNPFYRNVDRAIIAVSLGQAILEGQISPTLKDLGIKAIKRTMTPFGMNGMTKENQNEYYLRLQKILEVLNKF